MEWSNEAGEATTEDTSNMSPEELTALKLNRTSGTNHQDIDDATRFLRGTQMKTMGVQKRDVGIQAFTSLLRFEHTLSRQYGKGSFVLLLSFFLRSFGVCGLKGVVFFSSRFFCRVLAGGHSSRRMGQYLSGKELLSQLFGHVQYFFQYVFPCSLSR